MTVWQSPVGWLDVRAGSNGIHSITLSSEKPMDATDHSLSDQCVAQLREYFVGERTAFDVPLAPVGTPFRMEVWRAAQRIPYGETRTYAELASMIGRPGAARAVGNALKNNPIAILIPCHRIVSADGSIGGYAWGSEKKRILLALERSAH